MYVSIVSVCSSQSMRLGHHPLHKLQLVTLEHHLEPHPPLVPPVVVPPVVVLQALVSKLILPVFINLTIE